MLFSIRTGRARVARHEFWSIRREKTIILAVLIQLFIAGFSSFLLVGLVSLYDPGSTAGTQISIGVSGEAQTELVSAIDDGGQWSTQLYNTEEELREAFRTGQEDAAFITTRLDDGHVRVSVLVPDESVRSTVIVVRVREALELYERDRRDALAARLVNQPVTVPDIPDASPFVTFTYTVLLPLLVFLPVFISGSVAADSITEEIDGGTLDVLRTTPLSASQLIDGKMIAMISLAPLQAGAWLLLLWLNGTVIAHPVLIIAVVLSTTVLLVVAGTVLALVLRDRRSTQLVYSLTVIALFALAALLPESPPNLIAKLAIGSATPISYWLILGYALAAVAVYGVTRISAPRLIRQVS